MIVKIRGKIDLTMNLSVKTPLHGHKGVGRSGLWAPGGGLTSKSDRDTHRKIKIKPLTDTKASVAQA